MCHIYTSRYKCNCIAPDVEKKPHYCSAFFQNKPCQQVQKIHYLSSDCGPVCPGWQDPESAYREEFRREVADNHLYYGNKDVSQEDIFFEREELLPKRPQLILPSYEALNPPRSPSTSPKAKPQEGETPSTPSTPSTPDSDVPEHLPQSPGPHTPRSPETPKTPPSKDKSVDMRSVGGEGWESKKTKGQNVSKWYRAKRGR